MGKMEKTAQNELQEAVLFPKTKLCFETAFVTKFVQVALSKNQKINCPPKRGNSIGKLSSICEVFRDRYGVVVDE